MTFGDLCQLADVRAWLQTGTGVFPPTDDAMLARLITAASQFIQTWLNRPLLSQDWQEIRDGLGNYGLEARYPFAVQPATAVLLVIVDGVTIPAVPAMTASPPGTSVVSPYPAPAGYLFSPTQLVIRGYRVPRKAQCVLVQYTAGFPAPPPEVAQACIDLVCSKYRQRTRIDEVSKHLGDGATVTFSIRDMSPNVATTLQQYRLVAPIFSGPPQPAPTQFDPATLVAAAA